MDREVSADAGELVYDAYAELAQLVRGTDAREEEQFRRLDRASAENYLVASSTRAVRRLDANRAWAFEKDLFDGRASPHGETRRLRREWVKIGD